MIGWVRSLEFCLSSQRAQKPSAAGAVLQMKPADAGKPPEVAKPVEPAIHLKAS